MLLPSLGCNAPLAQLAEQRTLNPRVRGSSPWRRTRAELVFLPFLMPMLQRWYGRRLARVWPPAPPGVLLRYWAGPSVASATQDVQAAGGMERRFAERGGHS